MPAEGIRAFGLAPAATVRPKNQKPCQLRFGGVLVVTARLQTVWLGFMSKLWKIAIAAALLTLVGARKPQLLDSRLEPGATARFDGTLSVLTYNVKGLPWPVALGRNAAFEDGQTEMAAGMMMLLLPLVHES